MKKPLLIYIASPYRLGDQATNVRTQIEAAHRIMDMGHAPVTPLLSHFLDLRRSRPPEDWILADLAIVPRCDVVLRLPGESSGADREVELAEDNDVSVCFGWTDLDVLLTLLSRNLSLKKPESHARTGFVLADSV